MHKIVDSLKYIMPKDLFAPLIFLFAFIPALVYKTYLAIKKKPLWLVCENGDTARDNGYYFYRYMVREHPEINCRYVIRKRSDDYKNVAKLGREPIQAFGVKHYIMYLAAKWNISNHKSGNPNQILFYILHVSLRLLNNRVFLQHGITKDYVSFVNYKNARFKYFITGVQREFDYVNKEFGYPKGSVVLTGFPRFDTLIDNSKGNNQILIMPTWRNWLGRETNALYKNNKFEETEFFKNWNGLINSDRFIEWLKKNKATAIFYPHINMQKYISHFKSKSDSIAIADPSEDIQKLLRESSLMITDYSSVYMDFAYMRKPVIYYQFDYEEYRKKHLQQGYFSYEKDGFGPIFHKTEDVIKAINAASSERTKYLKRCEAFFPVNDFRNCERVFNVLHEKGAKTSI